MSEEIKYSIIVVCLNSGKGLIQTLMSIYQQTYSNYEVIIKDGGSTDGSLDELFAKLKNEVNASGRRENFITIEEFEKKVSIHVGKDNGIYDAMNQAVSYATGDYLLFMNTGDDLYQSTTLFEVTEALGKERPDLFYGNMYHKALDTIIYASPEVNDFTCYRNVPCHQTCFYHKKMFQERGYDPVYNVRADYEHFLWCFYGLKAKIKYVPVIVASYEGGGYSETKEHKKQSAKQHREIVIKYMGKKKADHYRNIMWLTLAPLRSKIAESRMLSPIYNFIKTAIYKCRKKG